MESTLIISNFKWIPVKNYPIYNLVLWDATVGSGGGSDAKGVEGGTGLINPLHLQRPLQFLVTWGLVY